MSVRTTRDRPIFKWNTNTKKSWATIVNARMPEVSSKPIAHVCPWETRLGRIKKKTKVGGACAKRERQVDRLTKRELEEKKVNGLTFKKEKLSTRGRREPVDPPTLKPGDTKNKEPPLLGITRRSGAKSLGQLSRFVVLVEGTGDVRVSQKAQDWTNGTQINKEGGGDIGKG